MRKRFSSSTRNRLHEIIFTGSKYINNFNITTDNIIHEKSRMDMRDAQRQGSIPKRCAWNGQNR